MHTQYYSIRPWDVAPACVRRIQYPLDCGRCEEVIWGQPQVIPDCGGFSRTLTTVAHSELVCTTSQVRMRPRSGIATQSPCILARLTLHPSGSLRGRHGPGAHTSFQAGYDRCLPPWQPLAGPGGSLCIHRPSGIQGRLNNYLHQTCAADGMGGPTQVFLRILRNTYRRGKCFGANVAPSASIRRHFRNTRDRPGPTPHH